LAIRDITRDSVLAAIREFDEIGRDAFLKKYGFGRSYLYQLEHEGRQYDSKAIVGAAHRIQFPSEPVPNFWGGEPTRRVVEATGFQWAPLGPGRHPQRQTQPDQNVWLFQYNPQRFDLHSYIERAADDLTP